MYFSWGFVLPSSHERHFGFKTFRVLLSFIVIISTNDEFPTQDVVVGICSVPCVSLLVVSPGVCHHGSLVSLYVQSVFSFVRGLCSKPAPCQFDSFCFCLNEQTFFIWTSESPVVCLQVDSAPEPQKSHTVESIITIKPNSTSEYVAFDSGNTRSRFLFHLK